jgi:hypothetical protein
MLKPQDLLVLLKLVVLKDAPWTLASVAASLAMSTSEVHGALSRAANAGLYASKRRRPNRAALQEFFAHGVRYAFAPKRLGMTRGVPTAFSAPGISPELVPPEVPLVWPDPEGTVRGEGIEPLYASAPKAARNDPALYHLLALVDALRVGGARERRVTAPLLAKELGV